LPVRRFFSFPHPVNDAAARTVALGVVTMCVAALATNSAWLLVPLTYGFLARVAAGPRISPLGRFAVTVAAPRIGRSARLAHWSRPVPGPPKRFAQGIGAVLTVSATALWLSVGWGAARWVLVPLVLAAGLEGFAGYCLGCTIFGGLIRLGLVPAAICEECGDLSARYARLAAAAETPPRA
jgi:hypothetical protein